MPPPERPDLETDFFRSLSGSLPRRSRPSQPLAQAAKDESADSEMDAGPGASRLTRR